MNKDEIESSVFAGDGVCGVCGDDLYIGDEHRCMGVSLKLRLLDYKIKKLEEKIQKTESSEYGVTHQLTASTYDGVCPHCYAGIYCGDDVCRKCKKSLG